MILSAQTIRSRCRGFRPMVLPFFERTRVYGLTFGLGPAGYDIRIRQSLIMWPLRFVCADSVEVFDIPADVKPNIQDKSTWMRRGISVQNTTMEPGWRGVLRLELVNHSWWFKYIRAGSPIAQVEFNLLDYPTELEYKGKYQDQKAGQDAIFEAS